MLTPLLTVLVLLAQAPAPASPDAPLSVLIAPPDAAGVPSHLVEFSQEHVSEQLKSRGLKVVRTQDALKKFPVTRRRRLLKCIQTERRCLQSLGEASKTEVVLVAELTQMVGDYRVGTKVYTVKEGALVAEHLVPGVREDGMLDALTEALDKVVPQVRRTLRPGSEPEPQPEPVKPPVTQVQPEVKPVDKGPIVTPPPAEVHEPARSAGLRRWAWAPAAGGAVFAGVGTYFWLDAKKQHERLVGQGAPLSAEEAKTAADRGRSSQNLSRIALGVGAAGLVTGAVFYLFPGDEKAAVRPTAALGPGGGMIGVAGTLP
ncbi:hypothetical protein P2318_03595 [Myxococcaceae bacterium GXIMD 01537]